MNKLSFEAKLSLSEEHPYFQGHFPQMKIYPGVAQLQDVCDLLQRHLKTSVCIVQASRVKFLKPIFPGADLLLKISLDGCEVQWEIVSAEALYCRGQGRVKLGMQGQGDL